MTRSDRKAKILQSTVEGHLDTRPEAMHPCFGAELGCSQFSKRAELEARTKSCAIAGLGPS
jgi:hypothetical protein